MRSVPRRLFPRLLAATGAMALVLAGASVPASAAPAAAPPGCQTDRRTVVHSGGTTLGTGDWTPCLIDTGMTSGESGLAITRDGTIMRSVATGPSGIAVSSDQGATWRRKLLPSGAQTLIADGAVDPVTDRYFYTGALNAPVYRSDDAGTNWKQGGLPLGAGTSDWPRLFTGRPVRARSTGYPNNVYYCNWTLPAGIVTDTACEKSTDGGATFTATGDLPYRLTDCPAGWTASAHGRGVVDARDGTIYLPAKFCGRMEVAVSHDEGRTWEHRLVRTMTRTAGQTLDDFADSAANQRQRSEGRLNPVTAELASAEVSDALAMDRAGRLYMTWIDDDYLPVVSVSADRGRTWSTPLRLGPPGVVKGALPALAVTPGGRVGVSYYATTDGYTWTGYLTVADGLAAGRASLQSATVTRPGRPLMDEPCCWVSGTQEYTAAHWSPDGSLWAAFAAYTPSGDAEGMVGRLVRS